jgi:hypothetical protein
VAVVVGGAVASTRAVDTVAPTAIVAIAAIRIRHNFVTRPSSHLE